MRLGRKIILCFVVAAGGVGTFFGVCLMDDPPPEDADLTPRRLDLAPEENGYTYAAQAGEVLYWAGRGEAWPPASARQSGRRDSEPGNSPPPSQGVDLLEHVDAMLDGTEPWDTEAAEYILPRNEEALGLVEKALACPHFQYPLEGSYEDWLPVCPWCVPLGKVLRLRCMHRLKQGNRSGALEDARNLLRFGHSLGHAGGPTIVYLVGVTVKGMGLDAVRDLAGANLGDKHLLKMCAGMLARFRPDGDGLAETFRVEYQCLCSILEDLKHGRATLQGIQREMPYDEHGEQPLAMRFAYFWQLRLNETKRLLADHMRTRIANAHRPYAERKTLDLVRLAYRTREWVPAWVPWNRAGRLLLSMLEGHYGGLVSEKCCVSVRVEALRARLVLQAFRAEHGRLPDRLDQLVPAYLDAVPRDDFDGRPLRYDPQKRVVYSVGKDLKDDGGMTQEEIDAWWHESQPEMAAEGGKPMPMDLPDPSWPIEF